MWYMGHGDKKVLITGASGFVGRNLCARLAARDDISFQCYDVDRSVAELPQLLQGVDCLFHLAGVNRPTDIREFEKGNVGFTSLLVDAVRGSQCNPHVVVSSSVQAALENPYGVSKRQAEEVVADYAKDAGARVSIFRLKNVFGKWCRANYNSVVATFCHNIALDLPIEISDQDRELELVCVDDVVDAFIQEMDESPQREGVLVDPDPIPSYTLTLGDLADRIRLFRDMQRTLQIPDFSIRFNQQLYATYLSYVPQARWEYGPEIRSDSRGNLAELVKSPFFGQVFVSRTRPGITRGNHYHHTKTEKFIVVAGEGLIRLRPIQGSEIIEIPVRGEDYRIVDIPPGYTHSITNTGDTEMITLFWASEPFDPDRADTYFLPVDPE